MSEENAQNQQDAYQVLARKYRPANFDEVIGQDALIRTLRNAIQSNRIHHAYMLTGIRGTGKTTTARLIARALNYTGPDGKAGPTTEKTDDCDICKAIAEGRHPDVMEMDAASRTGVDDIREILDGVRYAPTSARYKVYIIDEVHMLSKQAFNALLKTLEEPPPHVIFIFATTEIRKVPVTVLSRCQRFDLRRVDVPTLTSYYGEIAKKEGIEAEEEALALVARAADGSVRDGLSLLDQAISLSGKKLTLQQMQDMLGLADRTQVLDILENILKGDCAGALDLLDTLYKNGGDPLVIMQDMLDFTHLLTRQKAAPVKDEQQAALSPGARERVKELAEKLSMPSLGRAWQILLKGMQEVNTAPNPQAAAEMVVIRLSYAADLPDPAQILKKLEALESGETPAANAPAAPNAQTGTAGTQTAPAAQTHTQAPSSTAAQTSESAAQDTVNAAITMNTPSAQETAQETEPQPQMRMVGNGAPVIEPRPETKTAQADLGDIEINSLSALEQALRHCSHIRLASEVYHYVHLISMGPQKLNIRIKPEARDDLAIDLRKTLKEMTGEAWVVMISEDGQAQPTLAEQKAQAAAAELERAKNLPAVRTVIEMFPGTTVTVESPQQDNES